MFFSCSCILNQLNAGVQLQNRRGYKEFPPPLLNRSLAQKVD